GEFLPTDSLAPSGLFRLRRLRVEAVYPVGEEEIEQVNDGAYGPGDGIGPVDVAYLPEQAHDDGDIRHAQYAPDREHDEHGYEGFARAAADRCDRVGEGQQEVEERGRARLLYAVGDDAGIVVEDADERRREDIVEHADELRE